MNEVLFHLKGSISLKDAINFTYETTARMYLLVSLLMLIIVSSVLKQESIWLFSSLVIALACGYYWGMRHIAKRNYLSNQLMQQEATYEFLKTGVQVSFESGSSMVPWDKVYKVTVSRNCFAIFLSRKQALLLPQIWFTSKSNKDFEDLLYSLIPKKKFKKSILF
ncbi:YcxB family protein [Propionispora hippei]|uniref:YcxB-like protein n=1 Tax=Propionispora hippei DSM 15287 TaxID=1123003 RepID=A0A1M6CZX7_9FIRM|nr:YcxB family protein [Propionispora hippei]SHI66431.1 YcxB-like protein [Propionispora hippei DSM 15287]